ncbi:hypothetical protein [Hymenobacter arcticus]
MLGLLALLAVATHLLLWWQVLRGGWALHRGGDASDIWLLLSAVLWLLALLGFQLVCLLLWYSITSPTTGGAPWMQF